MFDRKENKNVSASTGPRWAMNGEIFNDSSMLEIFRAEVEAHVESLTSGLLALERNPGDTSHIDEMMRGAHSIKGAARIVGIDPAVRVAHVMEDGFVAAQNGKLTLRPAHVDVLLRGVDMLNRIANASKNPAVEWQTFDDEAKPLVAEITAVLSGAPISSPVPAPILSPVPGTTEQVPAVTHMDVASSPTESLKELAIPLPGFFNAAAAEIARRAFIAGLDAGMSLIRFDLSQTKDLDATALAFLAAVPAHIRQDAPRIELVGVTADLQNVMEATGIDRLYSSGGG
jgi:chemotaxis protein histidine kinase CheA